MSDIHRHDCPCENYDRCDYCGCCQHCDRTCTCKVHAAPQGMPCPRSDCGCEGRS